MTWPPRPPKRKQSRAPADLLASPLPSRVRAVGRPGLTARRVRVRCVSEAVAEALAPWLEKLAALASMGCFGPRGPASVAREGATLVVETSPTEPAFVRCLTRLTMGTYFFRHQLEGGDTFDIVDEPRDARGEGSSAEAVDVCALPALEPLAMPFPVRFVEAFGQRKSDVVAVRVAPEHEALARARLHELAEPWGAVHAAFDGGLARETAQFLAEPAQLVLPGEVSIALEPGYVGREAPLALLRGVLALHEAGLPVLEVGLGGLDDD